MAEAQLIPYEPTFRERSTKYVANVLRDKFGMDNYRAYDLARDIFGDESSPTMLGSLGIADFTPFGAVYGGQEGARMYQRSDDLVGKGLGAGIVGLSALEGFGPLGFAVKSAKKALPKTVKPDNPDLERRAVVKGLAALPVATTAVAKGIADLPIGAVAKAAKAVPNVTGSKLLDSLPFVRDELAPIFKNVLSGQTKIDYSAPYDPTPATPGGIPKPRPTIKQKVIDPEDKLFTTLSQLADLRGTIKYRDSSAKTLADIGDSRIRDYDRFEMGDENPADGITDNILNDLAEKYPDMSIDDAVKMIDKDGFDLFVESYKKGELENSNFVKFIAESLETTPAGAKKHIEEILSKNPKESIDTVVFDIFGSDDMGAFFDGEIDVADDIGRQFFKLDKSVDELN